MSNHEKRADGGAESLPNWMRHFEDAERRRQSRKILVACGAMHSVQRSIEQGVTEEEIAAMVMADEEALMLQESIDVARAWRSRNQQSA